MYIYYTVVRLKKTVVQTKNKNIYRYVNTTLTINNLIEKKNVRTICMHTTVARKQFTRKLLTPRNIDGIL